MEIQTKAKSLSSVLFEMDSTVVNSALEGFITANNGLVMLEGHRVILRRDYRQLKQVKLMSGGWSGLEPMYTGFVGPGFLTAAVVGEIYCVPPVTTILTTIRELADNNPYGVLIILKNHPVNKRNFMLAVEQAMRECISVKLIFVGDNCSAIVNQHGRNGLAGVALVFKIAGAMADQKRSMEDIFNVCSEVSSSNIATISLNAMKISKEETFAGDIQSITASSKSSFSKSTYSSKSTFSNSETLFDNSDDGIMRSVQVHEDLTEKRLSNVGLHSYSNVTELAEILLGFVIDGSKSPYSILKENKSPIVILVNNYGLMIDLELYTLLKELLVLLKYRKITVKRIYVGTVIRSRSIGGFSLTAMKANEDIIDCLDHPVTVSGWPTTVLYKGDCAAPLPKYIKPYSYFQPQVPKDLGPILDLNTSKKIYRALDFVCMALTSCEDQMNKLGSVSSNSQYGTHVKVTVNAITEALYSNKLKVYCPYALFSQLSMICSDTLHNSDGCIYGIFFDGISQSFLGYLNDAPMIPHMWTYALEKGITEIEQYTGLKKGDRSMLDALYPMFEKMKTSLDDLATIAEAAEFGSLNTVDSNVKTHSVPDPSAHTVSLWARAAVEGLISFRPIKEYNLQSDIDDLCSLNDIGENDSNSVISLI